MSQSIKEVKAMHEASLLALPGVVSVGIGRAKDGTSAIIVGLDSPARISNLRYHGHWRITLWSSRLSAQ